MKSDQTIFYDIDTQRDFILPDGKFYIPGADKIVPVWKVVTDLARDQKVQIVCSVDCHVPGDPLLKSWGGPYPDHCMAGTPGQKKIDETEPLNPIMLENREYTTEEIQKVLDHHGEIVFRRDQRVGGRRHNRQRCWPGRRGQARLPLAENVKLESRREDQTASGRRVAG